MDQLNNVLYEQTNTDTISRIIINVTDSIALLVITLVILAIFYYISNKNFKTAFVIILIYTIMTGLYINGAHPTVFNKKFDSNQLNTVYNITYEKNNNKLKFNKVNDTRIYVNKIEFDIAKNAKNNNYVLKNDKKNLIVTITKDEFKQLLEYANVETNVNIDDVK